MAVNLERVVVHATDPASSAALIAEILGLPVARNSGADGSIRTANAVTVDFAGAVAPFTEQRCAFRVDRDAFDAGVERLRALRVCIWADADRRVPDAVCRRAGGRAVYFDDLDGHLMELATATDGRGASE